MGLAAAAQRPDRHRHRGGHLPRRTPLHRHGYGWRDAGAWRRRQGVKCVLPGASGWRLSRTCAATVEGPLVRRASPTSRPFPFHTFVCSPSAPPQERTPKPSCTCQLPGVLPPLWQSLVVSQGSYHDKRGGCCRGKARQVRSNCRPWAQTKAGAPMVSRPLARRSSSRCCWARMCRMKGRSLGGVGRMKGRVLGRIGRMKGHSVYDILKAFMLWSDPGPR